MIGHFHSFTGRNLLIGAPQLKYDLALHLAVAFFSITAVILFLVSLSLFLIYLSLLSGLPKTMHLVSIHKALLIYSDPPALSPLSLQLAGCLQTARGEKGLEETSTGVCGGVGGGGVVV